MPVIDIKTSLAQIFANRGVPRLIKVDNGRPFGDPRRQGLPILALWLIGKGIDIIWNRPRTPQDNAKVERCQQTMGRWTQCKSAKSMEDLQRSLHQQAKFYNYTFRDRRRGNTTRAERFPTLKHTGRKFVGEQLDTQRIADFVAQGKWNRAVSKNGQVTISGFRFSIGQVYAGLRVDLKLDPATKCWHLYNLQGKLIQKTTTQIWDKWISQIKTIT